MWKVATDAWRPGVSPPPIELRPCLRVENGSDVRFLSFESVQQVPSEKDLQSMSIKQLCDMLERAVQGAEASAAVRG
jgi:hypothetical protein